MKLNPPASSSDLDAARAIAARLSVAAYGRRARKPVAAAAVTTHVEPSAPPLGEPTRATRPPARPFAPEPAAAPVPEPDVVPEVPQPSAEALAPHEEPALAEPAAAEPAAAEPAAAARPAHVAEAAAPPPAPPAEVRHDSGSITVHRPSSGKSRVDVLLQQALGRTAALGITSHRAEHPTHEPFVPIPTLTPDVHANEPAPPAHEPHAERPVAPFEDEQHTNPSFRVPDEIRVAAEPSPMEGAATERLEAPVEDEARPENAASDDAGVGGAEPAPPASEEPPFSRETSGAEEAVPEPPFGVEAEPPVPVDTGAFEDAAPAEGGNVFDPSALVGSEPAPVAVEEDVAPFEAEPEPPPPPSWADVVVQCLRIATTARGALVAGADGRLLASAGQWPAKAEAIAAKLVPLIEKAPRPATDEPLPIKLGPNVLSSWQFPVDGELLTAAFIGEAALATSVWPELKATLRR